MKQSLNQRLGRCADARAPRPCVRFIWVDSQGPSFEQQCDQLIACGIARATDEFVAFSWDDPGGPGEMPMEPPHAPP
jgi:hypothetical protein